MANIRTNHDVLNDPETSKDNYFLLGKLNETDEGYSIDADHICVAKNQSSAEMLDIIWRKEWDKPDTRPAICAEYGLPDNTRMIGAGGIVSVQIGDEEPKIVLLERTIDPNKGKMVPATGLSDANPLQVLWAELIEETGILTVDRADEKLVLTMPEPEDACDPAFASSEDQQEFLKALEQVKYDQIDNISKQLPEDIKEWDIVVKRHKVNLSPEDKGYLDKVTISLPDSAPVTMSAMISDSGETANVNIIRPVRVEFPEGTEVIYTDPEEFMRPVATFTRAEMLTSDFAENKASGLIERYLEATKGRDAIVKPQNDADICLDADEYSLGLDNLE